MKNKILLSGGILLLAFSCQKEVDKNTSQNATVLKNEVEDHDSSIIVDSASITWMSHENDIPSNGVSVYDDMLHFQSINDFESVIDGMQLKTENALLDWASSFTGYKSLLSYYDDLSNDPQVDDYEIDQNRLLDYNFESVVNTKREIRIEDSVYVFDQDFSKCDIYLVEEGIISGDPIETQSSSKCNSCLDQGACRHEESNAMYPDWCYECKIDGVKRVRNIPVLYSSVFNTSTYYERNWLDNWKRREISQIITFKDFYYNVAYFIPPNPPSAATVVSSDQIVAATDSKSAKKTYQYFVGVDMPVICVSEFGRTHNWAVPNGYESIWTPYYWENDVHVNQWPQF